MSSFGVISILIKKYRSSLGETVFIYYIAQLFFEMLIFLWSRGLLLYFFLSIDVFLKFLDFLRLMKFYLIIFCSHFVFLVYEIIYWLNSLGSEHVSPAYAYLFFYIVLYILLIAFVNLLTFWYLPEWLLKTPFRFLSEFA